MVLRHKPEVSIEKRHTRQLATLSKLNPIHHGRMLLKAQSVNSRRVSDGKLQKLIAQKNYGIIV
jgi:hypothetical protein